MWNKVKSLLKTKPMPAFNPETVIRVRYTNYKGETSIRSIVPSSIDLGSNKWHERPQWLLTAYDMDKRAVRTFALEQCTFMPAGSL